MSDETTEPATGEQETAVVPAETQEPVIDEADFNSDVQAYKIMERKTKETFISNLLDLGCLLTGFQAKWKPLRKWKDFLDGAKINHSTSNILIRLFDYSLKNRAVIEQCDLDGWVKIQNFVKLPDEAKEELAEKIKGETLSPRQFVEVIGELQNLPTEEDEVEDGSSVEVATPKEEVVAAEDGELDIPEEQLPDAGSTLETGTITDRMEFEKTALKKTLEDNALLDAAFLAERLLENLKSAGYAASKKCMNLAEAFTLMTKALSRMEEFERNTSWTALTDEEKEVWSPLLQEKVEALNKLV